MTEDYKSMTPARARYLARAHAAENTRLAGELAAARLLSANRLAAIRAALLAAETGELDPLDFLRDQLTEEATGPVLRPVL